jgi:hypothetical protein
MAGGLPSAADGAADPPRADDSDFHDRLLAKKKGRAPDWGPTFNLSAKAVYSSSIWLYTTRTQRGDRNGRFRMGLLHLVARGATSERLDDDCEVIHMAVDNPSGRGSQRHREGSGRPSQRTSVEPEAAHIIGSS